MSRSKGAGLFDEWTAFGDAPSIGEFHRIETRSIHSLDFVWNGFRVYTFIVNGCVRGCLIHCFMGSAGKVAMSSRQITQFVGVLLFIRDPRARSKAILRRGRNGCACCGGFRFPSTLHHIGFQILGARCGIRERDYNNNCKGRPNENHINREI